MFLENWVIPGCKFWAACRGQTDLCRRRRKKYRTQDKENAFLCECLVFYYWSIEYYRWIRSFNSCSWCAVWLCPSMWLSLPSPYQCPLKPSFPVGSRQNWMKDTVRSLLGPWIRACKSTYGQSGHISIYQKSNWVKDPFNPQQQRGIMSQQAKQVLFIFLQGIWRLQ